LKKFVSDLQLCNIRLKRSAIKGPSLLRFHLVIARRIHSTSAIYTMANSHRDLRSGSIWIVERGPFIVFTDPRAFSCRVSSNTSAVVRLMSVMIPFSFGAPLNSFFVPDKPWPGFGYLMAIILSQTGLCRGQGSQVSGNEGAVSLSAARYTSTMMTATLKR